MSWNFIIDTTTDILSNTAGIALAGKVFQKIGLDLTDDSRINRQHRSAIKTMAGLIAQGRFRYAEVDLLRNDLLFSQAMGMNKVYAPETIRIYLGRMAKELGGHVLSSQEGINRNLLNKVRFTPIQTKKGRYLPVDIDVSPMDHSRTRKEGVGRT